MIGRSVTQERLDFQLAPTGDTITGRAGLALFQEAALALGVRRSIKENLPAPGSGHGFKPQEYVLPLVMMLCGGGRTMEDIREIEMDDGLRQLCGFTRLPGADAIGQWLRKPDHLKGMKQVNQFQERQVIVRSSGQDDFTLDADATMIETKKQCADMTYLGYRAFEVLLSFIAELDLCVACDYRQGSVPAGSGVKKQLLAAHRLLKSCGKRLAYLRSDSAGYTADVINACHQLGVTFAITADQDAAVKKLIERARKQGKWHRLYDSDRQRTDREYTTAVHCMEATKAFTLIIQRWPNPKPDLFHPEFYCYHAIATSDYRRTVPEVIWFYNRRGDAENYNKELKSGFGMDYAPCRSLAADAVYFEIGVLAYNLTVAVKRLVLGGEWVRRTIASLRWQLLQIAGKVVRHGRQLILRVRKSHFELFRTVRQRLALLPAPG